MKRRYKILLGFALFLVAFYVWGFRLTTPVPSECAWRLDLAQLRTLAASLPGDKPREIHYERLGAVRMPESIAMTGGRFTLVDMPPLAYQLVFPDRTIVVDTAMDAAIAHGAHASVFDDTAWQRLQRGLREASAIYVTHEHVDHLGGICALADSLDPARVHLNPAQLAHPELTAPAVLPAAFAQKLTPFAYSGAIAVAPGVVIVAAPGHTPGSQLVFVTLADSREVLFVGDTAWKDQSIDEERAPPHATSLLMHNDREANACQLAALHALRTSTPQVRVVPGHDDHAIDALVKDGYLVRQFR